MGLKQIIANKTKSCTVASPRVCNSATFSESTVNLCNSQCNFNATTNIKILINKDSICNQQCNSNATGQKTDVQLLPLKTPEKLHTKNEELHIKITENTPLGGGDNSVISANSQNLTLVDNLPSVAKVATVAVAANDLYPKTEEKPVIPKTNLTHQLANQVEPLNQVHPQGEREPVQVQAYATDELLTRYEKPLFYHLLACPYCHVKKAQYCADGYAIGNVYDALLLNRDDAQARRDSLALRVDRACISGRSVFTAFNPNNAPPPPNTASQGRKYGNTPEYEAFINHWTACEVCKPNLGRYCSEGQRLEAKANNSYS